jgi:hypothetical protein
MALKLSAITIIATMMMPSRYDALAKKLFNFVKIIMAKPST